MSGLHLVLDLDETLMHTQPLSYGKFLVSIRPETYSSLVTEMELEEKYALIKRPYLDTFLDFCFFNFETVSVWTSAVRSYANAVVEQLFIERKPFLVWHRGMCKEGSKQLSVFAEVLASDTRHLVMVDDKCSKLVAEDAALIEISRWIPTPTTTDDTELLNVISQLELLIHARAKQA